MDYVAAYEDVVTSTTEDKASQTPFTLSTDTPRKQTLQRLIGNNRREIHYLRSKLDAISVMSVTPKRLNKIKHTFDDLEGVVSQDLLALLKTHVTLSTVKKHGRRDDDSLKAIAISIYHISGKAYRFLGKLFNSPSEKLSQMQF